MSQRAITYREIAMTLCRDMTLLISSFIWISLSGCSINSSQTRAPAGSSARFGHVFIIMLENESYATTFRNGSEAPYLAKELVTQGALLRNYYGIGHYSLDNYIATVSGQAPNPDTQFDCPVFNEFVATKADLDSNGQLLGAGCVYPIIVKTVADQLDAGGLRWKAYMEDMGKNPQRESPTCGHAPIGGRGIGKAELGDQYADKHNPFVYFHSIIDNRERCDAGVVELHHLAADLARIETTPNYAYISPNLCHDGHDSPCVSGERGGLASADAFLREWVPKIMQSPSYRKDGLIVITFDEALLADTSACCGEQGLPGGKPPGLEGPGGGHVGAVLLSPQVKPGTVSDTPYNHYSLLRFVEDNFGLAYLGYAASPEVMIFGDDVFLPPTPH